MDLALYWLFRWEKSITLREGEFPTYENQGLLELIVVAVVLVGGLFMMRKDVRELWGME